MIGSAIGPYDVIERLGAGGMGEVYLAHDRRLNRKVALKSLSDPSLDIPDARRRLLQEARAAARLTHSNIAAIHDIVDAGARPCIVMEYVQGETLAGVAARGPMAPAEAVAIGVQIADALAHAHGAGVIHRDLKPANVMVTSEGAVKILDFGVARIREIAPDSATTTSVEEVTRSQAGLVGTPAYMAPEQLLGRPASAQSDVYSLGALLFELLTGQRAFSGPDVMALALAIVNGPAPLACSLNPSVPEEVSAVVARAMAREPGERYQSAAEMKAALQAAAGLPTGAAEALPDRNRHRAGHWLTRRRLVLFSTLSLAVVAIVLWLTALRPRAASPVVGVLPLSGDNEAAEYLGAGISDSLIAALSRVRPVTVVSGEETGRYRGVPRDAAAIAGRHGATLLLAGGVRETGGRVAFSIKLIEPDGRVMWSDRYEGAREDIFALQRDAARDLVLALRVPVSADEQQRLEQPRTRNLDAYADYSLGRAMLNRSDVGDNVERAVDAFTQAISKDPAFAAARTGLADAYMRLYGRTYDVRWIRAALASIEASLRLAPDDPSALLMRAAIGIRAPGVAGPEKYDQAVDEIRRALATQPNSDRAHRLMGEIYEAQHRTEDAVREYRLAIAIRPAYLENHLALGNLYLFAGRMAEAKQEYERAIETQPLSPMALGNVAVSYYAAGDYGRSIEYSDRALKVDPNYDRAWSNKGAAFYAQGRYADAAAAFEKAVTLQDRNAISHRNLGDAYQRVGDRERALEQYRRAAQLSDEQLKVNPGDARLEANHALYAAKAGQWEEAMAHARHAADVAPADPQVLYKRAVVYALAKRQDEAIGSLERAVAAGYSARLAREDDDLASIAKLPQVEKLLREAR